MTDNIYNAEKQYRRFRMLLLKNRELISLIPCGSSFEIPAEYYISRPTDIDYMVCLKVANELRTEECHEKSEPKVNPLLIDTEGCHVGFTRLRKLHCLEFSRKPSMTNYHLTKGPAWQHAVNPCSWMARILFPPLYQKLKDLQEISMDRVYAIHCPIWPMVANEWLTRRRKNCWPSQQIIDEIVKLGCHLVAKPHQSNPNDDTQWRFSFSLAELILINSWTDVQKYIYHLLRVIKCEAVKVCGGEDATVLSTYFFKTLMLWACEEKPEEFWEEENLETSIGELLCMMIEWLIKRRCPNYFIPGNNMIDHLSEEVDFSKEILYLLHFKENFISEIILNVPKAYGRHPLRFRVPKELIVFGILSLSNRHIKPNSFMPRVNISSIDPDLFVPELRHLFDGIRLQKRMTQLNCIESSRKIDEIDEAKKYFELAMNWTDNTYISAQFCLNLSVGKNLQNLVDLAVESGTECGRNEDETKAVPNMFGMSSLKELVTKLWLSPAFFISTAYYANFLYSVVGDYKLASDQYQRCSTYLKNLDADFVYEGFFSNAFYILLTNEWSDLFDQHIQVVLGFLTLYKAYSSSCEHGRHHRVVFHLTPMEFLKYIHFQGLRQLNAHVTVSFERNFNRTCKGFLYGSNNHNTVSSILLLCAIYASGIQPERIAETTYSVEWPERKH